MGAAGSSLFVYGTLAFPEVVKALLDRELRGRPARLVGYDRRRVRGKIYPGIAPRAGAETTGIVYSDVDDASLALLDRFEGELYERREVATIVARDRSVRAFAYVIGSAAVARLGDEPWDESEFATRHLRAYVVACRRFRDGRL